MTQAEHFLGWMLYLTSFSTWISLDSVHCHKYTAHPFNRGNKAERVLHHTGQDLLRQFRMSFYSVLTCAVVYRKCLTLPSLTEKGSVQRGLSAMLPKGPADPSAEPRAVDVPLLATTTTKWFV